MKNLQTEIEEIHDLIVRGELQRAKQLFASLIERPAAQKRTHAVTLGALARRLRLAKPGLKLLRPYVRPRLKKYEEPTAGERAEYAAALIRYGLTSEGLSLLKEIIDRTQYPQTAHIEALAHISRWDYGAARKSLEESLEVLHSFHTQHELLIARVNLAESLIYLHQPNLSLPLLHELIQETDHSRLIFTHAKCWELLAEQQMYLEDYLAARTSINYALALMPDKESYDDMEKEKIKIFIDGFDKKLGKRWDHQFSQILKRAHEFESFETIRDLWFHWAKIHGHKSLESYCVNGTSVSGYLKFHQASRFSQPDRADIYPSYPFLGISISKFLAKNLTKQTILLDDFGLTKNLSTLLRCLSKDYFRPPTIYELYDRFSSTEIQDLQGQLFFSESTINRMTQLLWRLRQWIEQNKLPIKIRCWRGRYFLQSTSPSTMIRLIFPSSKEEKLWQTTCKHFSSSPFQKSDILKLNLDASARSLNRYLDRWVVEGKLRRIGTGKQTCYQLDKNDIPVHSPA